MRQSNAQSVVSITLRNGTAPSTPCRADTLGLMIFRAAEMLNSIARPGGADSPEPDWDSQMADDGDHVISNPLISTQNYDAQEAALEAKEARKYLLAKSYFDTREYDRCAAVFLPPSIPAGGLAVYEKSKSKPPLSTPQKGKATSKGYSRLQPINPFPKLSQKSLFIALYARYLSGEKRKDEESEMVLGPADGGMTVNRELAELARGLEGYFYDQKLGGQEEQSEGWLEYLYGVVLAKNKNDDEAKAWLVKSINLYPYHWGAWHELNDLISSVEEVRSFHMNAVN